MEENTNISQTVDKALTILSYVADVNSPVGVTQVSRDLRYSKSATFRFLETLAYHHYLYKNAEGYYEIGPKASYVGMKYRSTGVAKKMLLPVMVALRNHFNLGVQLCTLEEDGVMVVSYVPSNTMIQLKSEVGTIMPMHVSAAGKLLLGNMEKERVTQIVNQMLLERITEYSVCDPNVLIEQIDKAGKEGYAVSCREWSCETFAIAIKPPYEGTEDFAIVLVAPVTAVDTSKEGVTNLYTQIQAVLNP